MAFGGKRIAVTGLGAVSALGGSVEAAWQAAMGGKGGIARHSIDASLFGPPAQDFLLARVCEDYDATIDERLGRPIRRTLDPFARMALAPALEALDQAGLRDDPVLAEDTAVIFGHGFGGLETMEAGYQRVFGERSSRVHPATVPRVMLSAAVSAIAMTFGVRGAVFAVSSACASSAHAIAQGAGMIATGQAKVAIVGGSEAVATPGSLFSWEAIRAMSKTGCRPFAEDRDGMVLGEGGAAMILEDMDHARARGAPVLGELIGAGMSSDAFNITQPSAAGQARAVRQAARQADILERDDILISAHGTGTPLNDAAESETLLEVFGERGRRLPVIATKSAHGHVIGGSAALQAVLGLKALAEGRAPAVLNVTRADPACDLDLVVGAARRIASRVLLQNAFAFGGLNVSLAFAGAGGA
ncbi:beta-ketoacyl-[acyl-carrier-protein] synthase family protein [Phenylobacterium sp.]|jgi:nodulation protein E|uniref:beta-ketoacyl-[acyl-carrier-protein] synthase family protein n=1 Tax=Phenylobacterium sp. TaxID=1871053 RepID=UPI002F416A08